jgi:hypothetical protein
MAEDKAPGMTLRLGALDGGAYTQLTVTGPMPTAPQRWQLRRLLALLSLWGGAPVEVVLCVGRDTAGWMEIWDEALMGVPARQLRVRFLISHETLTGGNGAPRP